MLSKYLPRHLRATADPAATPPATPPAPTPPTPEELQAKAKRAVAAMWGDDPAEPTPPAPIEPAPPVTPPATPPADPGAVAPPAPAAPADPMELIRQTAEATGKAIAEQFKPAAQKPPEEPVITQVDQSQWTDEDKHTYEQLKYLEQANPEEYAGKSEAFVQFLPKLAAYQDDWLAKNPGQSFDPNADEHNDWYAANQTLDADQIENDVRIQKAVEKRLQPVTAEITQRKQQEEVQKKERALSEAQATIDGEVTDKVAKMISLTEPTLADKLKDDKGAVSIGEDSQKRVEEADPIAARVLKRVAQTFVSPLVAELAKMAVPNLDYQFSPKTNPAHARILQFQAEAEKRILAKPLSQQQQDGKQFVTIERWRALFDQAVRGKSPEEANRISEQMESRYWTIGIDEVQDEIVTFGAARAKEEIAEWKGTAAKQFGKTPAPKPPTPPSSNVQVVAPPTPNNGKPNPPSLPGRSDLVTTPAAGGGDQKSFAERATQKYFSR